eukprot:CAMPEP_0174728554 /NCGR_PEP_ID=MMETSP1094-20130205/51932_1 /TAXON_ID=156173 /ORGANISM="Chrysochromulina brevifilum, Strain UTEX LB 985" /LENGTH=41 /DNA_ID= /DNA_START= /DNA_END= /DNA_ORIENTATION=
MELDLELCGQQQVGGVLNGAVRVDVLDLSGVRTEGELLKHP